MAIVQVFDEYGGSQWYDEGTGNIVYGYKPPTAGAAPAPAPAPVGFFNRDMAELVGGPASSDERTSAWGTFNLANYQGGISPALVDYVNRTGTTVSPDGKFQLSRGTNADGSPEYQLWDLDHTNAGKPFYLFDGTGKSTGTRLGGTAGSTENFLAALAGAVGAGAIGAAAGGAAASGAGAAGGAAAAGEGAAAGAGFGAGAATGADMAAFYGGLDGAATLGGGYMGGAGATAMGAGGAAGVGAAAGGGGGAAGGGAAGAVGGGGAVGGAGASGAATAGGGSSLWSSVQQLIGGGTGSMSWTDLISPALQAIGGAYTASQAGDAADASIAAGDRGIAESRRQFDTVMTLLSPYMGAGTEALGSYRNLSGAGGAPAQQAAITALQGTPQFGSLVKQGEDAILANASATGGLRGGNTQGALADRRTQILSGLIDQQLGRYGSLIETGQNSAARVGTAAMGTGQQVAGLMQQQGAAQAGGIVAGTNALVNSLGGAGGFFAGYGSGGTTPAPAPQQYVNRTEAYGGGVVPVGYGIQPRSF